MQVEPNSTIPLVYNIVDPSDVTTYYPQAIIKDSSTGTTLATKNLTVASTGRYISTYIVPVDSTGLGKHIDITITVYTDAARTVVSSIYERKIDKYLVRTNTQSFGGGGGGSDVNYDKIQRMIDASLKKIVDMLSEDKSQPLSNLLSTIKNMVTEVDRKVSSIEIPENEKPDLSPIITSISENIKSVIQKIEDKEVTSLEPVAGRLDVITQSVDDLSSAVKENDARVPEIIKNTVDAVINTANDKQERSKRILEVAKELQNLTSQETPVESPFGRPLPKVEPDKTIKPYV